MKSKNPPFTFVQNDGDKHRQNPNRPKHPTNQDIDLLDAYSRAVIGVVDRLASAVLGIAPAKTIHAAGQVLDS